MPVSYLNCPRCALSIRVRADFLTIRSCPRCLARAGAAVSLYETEEPAPIARFRRRERVRERRVPPGF